MTSVYTTATPLGSLYELQRKQAANPSSRVVPILFVIRLRLLTRALEIVGEIIGNTQHNKA